MQKSKKLIKKKPLKKDLKSLKALNKSRKKINQRLQTKFLKKIS